MADFGGLFGREMGLRDKLYEINWGFVLLIAGIASVGFAMLYSVADGSLEPWASRQMVRFAIGIVILLAVAMVDIRIWMRLAYPAYIVSVLLLIAVELIGTTGMGAQRWVELGPLRLQPSEITKITTVLALARYYQQLPIERVSHPFSLLPALMLVALPSALVLKQPDLGTTLLLVTGGGAVIFVAGLSWKYLAAGAALALGAIPIVWQSLHDYQRERVFTFLDPSRDPLGAGYHITQSKIALGSGGVFGKGYMQGTQSHLNFLPEKHTDFIFTMLAEEFGLVGGLGLVLLYMLALGICFSVAFQCRNQFGRLTVVGIAVTFFLYIFINTAMVMGLVPVVGVPLPLVSYGGTAMLTLMFGFGLVMSVYVHRSVEIKTN